MAIRSLRILKGEFTVFQEEGFAGESVTLEEGFSARNGSDADLSSIKSFSVVINNVFCTIGFYIQDIYYFIYIILI